MLFCQKLTIVTTKDRNAWIHSKAAPAYFLDGASSNFMLRFREARLHLRKAMGESLLPLCLSF